IVVFLIVGCCRPARVDPEEGVHVALVLLQRLCPELEIGLPSIGDGVHPPRRTTLGGIPGALHRPVLLHAPQGSVQVARVRRLHPKLRHPLHQLVPVRVPLPEHHQDHRLRPVRRTSLGLVGLLGSLVLGILPGASSLLAHVTPLRLQRYASCRGCPAPPRVARRAPLGALRLVGAWGSPLPSRLSASPRRTARKPDRPSAPPIGGRVWTARRLRRRAGGLRSCRQAPSRRPRERALSLPNSPSIASLPADRGTAQVQDFLLVGALVPCQFLGAAVEVRLSGDLLRTSRPQSLDVLGLLKRQRPLVSFIDLIEQVIHHDT